MNNKNLQRQFLKSIVGSARIEGLLIDSDTLADAHCVIEGELTTDEAIARLLARTKHSTRT